MRTPRPILAALALAICASGYVAPWALGMWQSGADVVGMTVEPEPEREVRLLYIPPEPPPEEPELPVEIVEVLPDEPAPPAAEAVVAAPIESPIRIEAVLADAVAPEAAPRFAIERKKRSPRKRRTKACEPDRDDIETVADTAFRVEDRLVYFYANHVPEANKLAATWWNKDGEGERYGFKVGRMKCGSVLHQAGFRNGDVIVAVNGLTITSYADGVTAYMRLRAKRVLWVDVLRRGEPMRLDFVLVDEGTAEAAFDEEDPLFDPTTAVERELELDELPWLERRWEKGKDRRKERQWRRERG